MQYNTTNKEIINTAILVYVKAYIAGNFNSRNMTTKAIPAIEYVGKYQDISPPFRAV